MQEHQHEHDHGHAHHEAKRFLSPEDRDQIVHCVKEAEKHTSGEIMPLVVRASYHYPLAVTLGALAVGLVLAAAATAAVSIWRPWAGYRLYHLWVFPGVFAVAFLMAWEIIRRVPPLKRLFISHEEMEDEVSEAALTYFYRRGLDKTRDRTGVLLFVSVFERKVQILADSGINDKVDPAVWKDMADAVAAEIRRGRPGAALCRGVERCGELLKSNFPARRDDLDELDNLIIEE